MLSAIYGRYIIHEQFYAFELKIKSINQVGYSEPIVFKLISTITCYNYVNT